MKHTVELAASGKILLGCPTVAGGVTYVTLPTTAAGIAAMRRILAAAAAEGDKRIANRNAPTQYDIEAMLKAFTPQPKVFIVNGKEFDLGDIEI